MYEPPHYDTPPAYSPPYSTSSQVFYPPRSVHSPQSLYIPYTHNVPPDSSKEEGEPQHFYRWFSPPGFVKTFHAVTALMCLIALACVAAALVWDINDFNFSGGITGMESGFYGSVYSYSSTYISYSHTSLTPLIAKVTMISMTAVTFLVSLSFLAGSSSKSKSVRGCRFYYTVFICDIILAVLQVIVDIIFVIGVNPMAQSSQSMLYDSKLMMCQTMQGTPSLSGSVGFGFGRSKLKYNLYLYHYCNMDPEEAAALVLGVMVVLTLSLSAYFAYKTRNKILRHGKANIFWDKPRVRASEGQDVQSWVDYGGEARSTRLVPSAPDLMMAEHSVVSYNNGTVSVHSDGNYKNNRAKRKVPEPRPAAAEMESQYETGYTTGDTGNELDRHHTEYLYRQYPEIISDEQRHQYKKEFDSDLACYKTLCAEMDDIRDQMHKLNRELDTLDEDCLKYQGVADEYNRLKDLKRTPGYQAKKKQCKELRSKLFHIKRLVKIYDQGLC